MRGQARVLLRTYGSGFSWTMVKVLIFAVHASVVDIRNYLNRISEIVNNNQNYFYFIIGDYNAPDISWAKHDKDNFYHGTPTKSIDEKIIDTFSFLDVKPISYISNHNNRILVLCFANLDHVNVEHCISPLVKEDSHHLPLEIN
ncbi:hypothetical protein JTB14_022830 [Gonioctena quinquepunctata]|nr:hypothetical protein JTB14_022830 [Gonioctena quinquepunctata]